MEKRVVRDILDFFDAYTVANLLTECDVTVHVNKGKKYINIRVSERPIKRVAPYNLVCDMKMVFGKVTMKFKIQQAVINEAQKVIDSLEKLSYKIKVRQLGTQVEVSILDPTIEEVKNSFLLLEKYCKRPV